MTGRANKQVPPHTTHPSKPAYNEFDQLCGWVGGVGSAVGKGGGGWLQVGQRKRRQANWNSTELASSPNTPCVPTRDPTDNPGTTGPKHARPKALTDAGAG